MQRRNPLLIGTVILTVTGLLSRFIGFFYRIFLSKVFGAEGMGIYQLTSPVLALSFSLTVAGMQTAISKYVASETSTHDYKTSFRTLWTGFVISMSISFACMAFIYKYSEWIAVSFLLEERTAPLLRIISLSIPMATVHSCINGYFYGIKKTAIPALSQLSEQVVRVGSVYLIYYICLHKNMTPTISFAVVGLVIGESASMFVSAIAIICRSFKLFGRHAHLRVLSCSPGSVVTVYKKITENLLKLAVPLSANRIIINILQSIEAVFIPNRLMLYGLSNSNALSVYGVLNGMSLPLILFPSAITNSISVLLLPIVSEAEASGNRNTVTKAIIKSIKYCMLLGFGCTLLFLLFGRMAGMVLYNSRLAGSFILTLSFICPFMYVASTLNSILNGLGKTHLTFIYSIISLLVRLAFVFFAIPIWGIKGYLWGMLASQMVQTLLCTISALRISRMVET
ncbi:MAG: polysaccharide biosynthesis protein [Lachnospiraceae bacterium]|nr:polysaccharide biosynthesis protein [Lachnospiraceae bacterium]